MSESLIHSLNQYVQMHWFIQELNKWLFLRVSHWINYSTDLFKNTDSFAATVCYLEMWTVASVVSFGTFCIGNTVSKIEVNLYQG